MDDTHMTPQQAKAVQQIRYWIRLHYGYDAPERYEFKRFDVTVHDWSGKKVVEVISEYGLKGDDHTAAPLVRDHRQLFIGPRGGIRLAGTRLRGRRAISMRGNV